MSEKKYYVKSLISCEPYTSDADKGWLTSTSNDSATWIYKKYRTAFTKSELAEIMGGAIYKKEITDVYDAQTEQMGFPEWINPLIELVPVMEDGE